MGRCIAQQAFELLAVIQQAGNHLFLCRFAQARLVRQRLGNRHGLHALDRDHLRQAVYLPVGHLQHPAHVAHGGFGQKGAKGDDLAHPVAAIFGLHVVDHFFAAVHAKVDVEIGHGHTFGVQEPLEQQAVAQRIKVGDGQGIGHQRPRARSPARPNGNALFLGPLNEISHDQEIAGETHLFDDTQFKLQPLGVVVHRHCVRNYGQPCIQPLTGKATQGINFIIGEFRQNRVALEGLESTAAGDFDRVFQRFRQIGKQGGHFSLGLEIVLRRQPPARGLLIDISPFGDANQRIMRLVHIGLREIDIVGRDQRQAHGISHLNQPLFTQRLGFWQAVAGAGVAL